MFKVIYILVSMLFLFSCSGFKDAGKVLRNEKIRTTDEFLVKKREPLVFPPEYKEIPEPGSSTEDKSKEEDNIKKILKVPKEKNNKSNGDLSVEDAILKKIRK